MSPSRSDGCVCPSDLFQCDDILGCVCPVGVDCGIGRGRGFPIKELDRGGFNNDRKKKDVPNDLNQVENTGSTASKQAGEPIMVIAVVSLLLVCLAIGAGIVIYYRWE